MNVKIDENALTFKIMEEEMNRLLTGVSLEKKIVIGQNTLTMMIDPCENYADCHAAPLKLIQDRAESRLTFHTTQEEIRKLADMGRNREGLSVSSGDIQITLQVDIRSDTRGRRKA